MLHNTYMLVRIIFFVLLILVILGVIGSRGRPRKWW